MNKSMNELPEELANLPDELVQKMYKRAKSERLLLILKALIPVAVLSAVVAGMIHFAWNVLLPIFK